MPAVWSCAVAPATGVRGLPEMPAGTTRLDQVNCEFTPRVVIAPARSPIVILNTDNFLHSFHTISVDNPPVDRAQPNVRKVLKEEFSYPEIIEVGCDLHAWMKAWIVVVEHPYYTVTDDAGAFVLTDVPAGPRKLIRMGPPGEPLSRTPEASSQRWRAKLGSSLPWYL